MTDPSPGPVLGHLHRERPDVDLVVLPPVDPRPAGPPASAEEVEALADRVLAAALELRDVLGLTATDASQVWWRGGDGGRHRYVVRVAFHDVEPREVEPRLARLARHLDDEGWHLGPLPAVAGDDARGLLAHRAPLRVRAQGWSGPPGGRGSVALRVESDVVVLDAATARALGAAR